MRKSEKRTYQAMEALIHNLNTMHSRAGAQVPFSSINYGTDTSPEGRLVMEVNTACNTGRPWQRRNTDIPYTDFQGKRGRKLQSGGS